MAKITTTETGAVRATIATEKKPRDMKDYKLQSVNFDDAENGVVASCRFKLKPEAEKAAQKAAKSKNNGYIDYDVRNPEEKYVFEDMQKARAFLDSKLAEME